MNKRIKFFVGIAAILLFFGFGYYYKDGASRLLRIVLNRLQPCQRPITYSIANLDPHFGLTSAELLNSIKQVEKIWESSINKQLFEYSPTGYLKINFIYDYRQQATDALRKIGIVVDNDRSTYDELKTKYDSLVSLYGKEKAQLDVLIAVYSADKSAYEKNISYWNGRNRITKEEYNILEQKRADLNNQVAIINQAEKSLNELVDTINSAKLVLNKLVVTLNLQINAYNTVGSSASKEFNEGEYVSNASGAVIDIFQFNNKNQLTRVIAHEFGHALGLGHIDNPKAIMYYLNEGINEKLTTDDLSALKKVCGIK